MKAKNKTVEHLGVSVDASDAAAMKFNDFSAWMKQAEYFTSYEKQEDEHIKTLYEAAHKAVGSTPSYEGSKKQTPSQPQ